MLRPKLGIEQLLSLFKLFDGLAVIPGFLTRIPNDAEAFRLNQRLSLEPVTCPRRRPLQRFPHR